MLKINQAEFLAIDFEYRQVVTQKGLSLGAQVSEIGLAGWKVGEPVSMLVDHKFLEQETLEDYWTEFAKYIETKQVLVAHARGTEKKFLQQAYPHLKEVLWVDTLVVTKALYPELPNYELGAICHSLGLTKRINDLYQSGQSAQVGNLNQEKWHDAGYDALACLVLWSYLVEQAQWENDDLLGILAHFKLS